MKNLTKDKIPAWVIDRAKWMAERNPEQLMDPWILRKKPEQIDAEIKQLQEQKQEIIEEKNRAEKLIKEAQEFLDSIGESWQ